MSAMLRKKTAMELQLEAEEEEERAALARAKDKKKSASGAAADAIAAASALLGGSAAQHNAQDFDGKQHYRDQRDKQEREHRKKCEHLKERLWNAVKVGDDDEVFLVIRHVEKDEEIESFKEIIDPQTADGVTPLYTACKNGHVECSRQLINAGAACGKATKSGKMTPLFAAAGNGNPKCIELLLNQADVRVDYRTGDNRTALYAAAESGNVKCVELLLERGAAINAQRKDGSTPLIVAAYFGHTEVVDFLIEAGAKLLLRDEDGTAKENAQRQKHTRCVELLSKAEYKRGKLEMLEAPVDGEPTPVW